MDKVQAPRGGQGRQFPGLEGLRRRRRLPGFSAVLYFFGQRLHKDLDVPVGLVNSSWGGSPIEPWTVTGTSGGGMYNGMIAPVKPFAIRGAIWYQGESNVGNGLAYSGKMKALIEGWRKVWGYDFPFYFVQIAPFAGYGPGALPPLWEAQVASLKIPKTGMAVTTDLVQNIGDIHPSNKIRRGQPTGAVGAWPRSTARRTSCTQGRSTSP